MTHLLPLLALSATLAVGAFAACGGSPAGTNGSSSTDAGHPVVPPGTTEGGVEAKDGGEPDGNDVQEAGGEAGDDAADANIDANGPPFGCGPSMECFEVTQFCSQVTGPHGGTFYNCNAAPSECANDVSCACLLSQGITSPCSEMDGGILVTATEP